VDSVHTLMGSAFAHFSGDTAVFEPLRPDLEACLSAQYKGANGQSPRYTKALLAIGAVAVLAIFASALGVRSVLRSERRWQAFVAWLNGQPGIVVTSAEKRWFGHSRVAVLRDPLALEETAWAAQGRQEGVPPVDFVAKPFLALDDVSVQRRIVARFGEPPGSRLSFARGVVELAGPVPYEWLERFRREATQVPGVSAAVERGVEVTYDPTLVLRRFTAAFPPPATVTAHLRDGTLLLSGAAPYEWMTPVRAGATRLPGIKALSEKDLQVSVEPAFVLKRFEEHFGLPETVNASVREDVLVLAGEASHRWIERVRQGLKRGTADLPGIASLDAAKLADLDQTAFRQAKSIIESASVYFLPGKDKFATDGFAALSRLPEEIRRCQAAAKRIGLDFSVEIRGYSDAVGTHDKNLDLSSRRAQAVQEFLLSCGLDASILKTAGLGEAVEPASTLNPAADASDRRVSLRVLTQPSATAP
jgi:outer membrane protein OmpA-like peptidoglycan-associated protein